MALEDICQTCRDAVPLIILYGFGTGFYVGLLKIIDLLISYYSNQLCQAATATCTESMSHQSLKNVLIVLTLSQ
jgi:hypothetical protein